MRSLLLRIFPPDGRTTRVVRKLLPVLDFIMTPFTFLASTWLCAVRMAGVKHFPFAKRIFRSVGVFPIRDHFFEPMVNPTHLWKPLDENRELPGIELNIQAQLERLAGFDYNDELKQIPLERSEQGKFFYNNPAFGSGDAEILYSFIRSEKPRRFIEVGSGFSTLLAREAIEKNKAEDSDYDCELICIEPYEAHWLEELGIQVIRERLEHVPLDIFKQLDSGDMLFIDSSHVIRAQGDVVREYLEILPSLRPGVFIHIHDIYTPKDYGHYVLVEEAYIWTEQYLLEALLMGNPSFEIVFSIYYLAHHHRDALLAKCPILRQQIEHRTGASFWIRKVK